MRSDSWFFVSLSNFFQNHESIPSFDFSTAFSLSSISSLRLATSSGTYTDDKQQIFKYVNIEQGFADIHLVSDFEIELWDRSIESTGDIHSCLWISTQTRSSYTFSFWTSQIGSYSFTCFPGCTNHLNISTWPIPGPMSVSLNGITTFCMTVEWKERWKSIYMYL